MADQPKVTMGNVQMTEHDQKFDKQSNSLLYNILVEQIKTNRLLELLLSNSNETLAVTNWHKQESRRMMEKVAGLDTSVDDTPVGPA